ncbi:MAG: efflux RND transporter periplasmic adaptor subunit [Pseudomonadota bacterium]
MNAVSPFPETAHDLNSDKEAAPARRKWLIPLLGLVTIGALGAALLFPSPSASETSARAVPVEIVTLQPESSMAVQTSYIGRVEARRRSELGFELGGELQSISVDEGDVFQKGQVLARLDPARLQVRRAELTSQVARARAQTSSARALMDRSGTLFATAPEAISAQEVDDARYAYEAAEAQISALEAQVKAINVDLARARLIAPYSGRVAERSMDEGQIAPPGASVLTIVETARPQARIGIPATRNLPLNVGAQTKVLIDGEEILATVRAVSPSRSEQTRTVDLILTLEAQIGAVREGDLATLQLESAIAEEGFWVPITALSESRRGLWSVFVAEQTDGADTPTLARRDVELIGQTQERAFIRGAVAKGDKVVATGLQRLAPGVAVTIARQRTMD